MFPTIQNVLVIDDVIRGQKYLKTDSARKFHTDMASHEFKIEVNNLTEFLIINRCSHPKIFEATLSYIHEIIVIN